jgi:hypothetical protein
MLFMMLMSTLTLSEGEAAAMDAFDQGKMHLVYIGELPPEGHRDSETGMLLEPLGCEWGQQTEQFCDNWNSYMLYLWSRIGSDSTSFVIKSETETESLEYGMGELIYRDEWGSVPIEIFPEELSALLTASDNSDEDIVDDVCFLEMYSLLREDTIRTELSVGSPAIAVLFDRGRREIRRNQMVN